jgi:hypothetical protein
MSVEELALSAGTGELDAPPWAGHCVPKRQSAVTHTRIFLKIEKIMKQNRCRAGG